MPGVGNPLATFGADSTDRLQRPGVVADHGQHFSSESIDQLLRQHWPNTFYETAGQISFDTSAGGWWNPLQDFGFELQTMLFIPNPPAFRCQPFPGAHRWQRTEDRHRLTLPSN